MSLFYIKQENKLSSFSKHLTTEMMHLKLHFQPWSQGLSCVHPCFICVCVQDQFEQHVHTNVKLNVYLYYGSDRNRSKEFLSSQDVVITTYNVLSADFGVSVDVQTGLLLQDEPRCSHGKVNMGEKLNMVVQTVHWLILIIITDNCIFSFRHIMFCFQNNSPLHGINWLRVVLDEGHVIRNPNAQMSKAVLDLKTQRRWILSGISAP